jgi:hypothetical protein
MDLLNLIPKNAGPQTRAKIRAASDKIEIMRRRGLVGEADVLAKSVADSLGSGDFNSFKSALGTVDEYYEKAPKPDTADYVPPEDPSKKKVAEATTAASISAVNSLMDRSIKSGNKIDPGLVQTITELAKYDPDKAIRLAESSMPILEVKEDAAPKKTEANITFEQNAAAALRYADSLSDAINKYGTSETVDPAGSAILKQLPYQMAISYAKLVDPTSVAREGEVASAEKYLIPLGVFTRDDTAKEALKNFRSDIVSRIDQYQKSTGKEMSIENKVKAEPVKTQQPTVTSSNTYFNKFSQPYPQSPTR